MPLVAVYGKFTLVVPMHTAGLEPRVIVGTAFTATVIADELLTQPLVLLRTVKVALYVAAAAPAGTTNTIGVEGRLPFTTSTKPAVSAAPL